MKPKQLIVAFLAALALANVSFAADPTGEEIVDRYIELTGGKARLEAIKSSEMAITMDIPQAGIKGDATVFQVSPNLYYFKMEMPGVATMERGYDGTTPWEKSSATGTRIIEGAEAEQVLREASISAMVNWREHFPKAEAGGKQNVGGKDCYKVKMTSKGGSEETRYYDIATGLLIQSEAVLPSPMGELPVTSKFEDYREVDGVKMPYKTTQELTSMGQSMVMTVNSMKFNVTIPTEKFVLPDDVKKLRDKPAATKPAAK